MLIKNHEDQLIYETIGGAMEVYNHFGPGLLESVYHKALFQELKIRGLPVQSHVPTEIFYKGAYVSDDLKLDLLVDEELVVELKAVERLQPVHFKQVRTYMKLLDKTAGLLINFDVADFKDGYKVVKR